MSRRGLAAALGVISGANVLLLGATLVNRAGTPEAGLTVTERELPVAYQAGHPGGPVLRLRWVQSGGWLDEGAGWFNQAKLEQLGFDCSVAPSEPRAADYYARTSARRVFAALEYEGEAWQEWASGKEVELDSWSDRVTRGEMTRAEFEDARDLLERTRRTRSRLFAVDAALDASALRQRYPDRSRYLIVRAVARPDWRAKGGGQLRGVITEVVPDAFPVSTGALPAVDRPDAGTGATGPDRYFTDPGDPTYRVRLVVGRLHAPWIETVEPSEP